MHRLLACLRKARLSGLLDRTLGDRGGFSAVEFAFIVPIFVLLVAGAAELANYGLQQGRMTSAAKAGTHYGLQDQSTAADTVGIAEAARTDAGDTAGVLDIQSERYCRCPGANSNTACTGECADEEYVPMYLRVTVSNSHSALFPFLGIPLLDQVSSTNVVRVR
jgi:Flp pilus assembly protein TadG